MLKQKKVVVFYIDPDPQAERKKRKKRMSIRQTLDSIRTIHVFHLASPSSHISRIIYYSKSVTECEISLSDNLDNNKQLFHVPIDELNNSHSIKSRSRLNRMNKCDKLK